MRNRKFDGIESLSVVIATLCFTVLLATAAWSQQGPQSPIVSCLVSENGGQICFNSYNDCMNARGATSDTAHCEAELRDEGPPSTIRSCLVYENGQQICFNSYDDCMNADPNALANGNAHCVAQ